MNVCIVGYGAIGPVHAEAIKKLDKANLYAVCDILKERADKGASEYGAKAYYSFDECVVDENIDVVHICTPHYLHFEMIKKALDNGKRVVVEKPVVMKKEELDILFEKYDTTKIYPIVQNRTNTCIDKLKKIVEEDKELGKLIGVKGILTWSRDEKYYNSSKWRGTAEYEGGGVLINQAIHILDLMVYFAGGVKKVISSTNNYSLKNVIEVEDTTDAYIEFKNGAKGILYATNAYCRNSSMQLEIEFENRSFKYTDGILISKEEIICRDSKDYKGKSYWGNGHAKTLSDFYDNKSTFSLVDVKDTMYAMFAIYESAGCRKEIEI